MNQTELKEWWEHEFKSVSSPSSIDFMSRDGTLLLEVQRKPQGMRGFYAGTLRLAIELERYRNAETACLIIDASNLSLKRLKFAWNEAKKVITRIHGKKLAIIAVKENETWVEPTNQRLVNRIASNVRNIPALGFSQPANIERIRAARKADEIVKVLISRWLQHLKPIGIGELGEIVGCSYPTVRKAIAKLEMKNNLYRDSGSTVQLKRFPEHDWRRIVALAPTSRNTIRFADHSGQKPNTKKLLDRLCRMKPERVALGGVIAGRHWNVDFDLNGIPRLDLLVHEESQSLDLGFMKKLDPALKKSTNQERSPVVVVHTVGRANPDFIESMKYTLPLAGPVETVLDLVDIGLPAQAHQLLSHFRKEVRYS